MTSSIHIDPEACFAAFASRDSRFDGVVFMGVKSTGIYCRTICRARRPLRRNCLFFQNATLAEQAGFRPCKLCKPEQSPGLPMFDFGSNVVSSAIHRIEQGELVDGQGVEHLANKLGVSGRHMRRVFQERMGITPVQLAQTQRLLMAKRLLSETQLPIVQVAMASGFGSLRRCNALFKATYGLSPLSFRRQTLEPISISQNDKAKVTLTLGYRPPYAWPEILKYFQGRLIPGVEWIDGASYARTLQTGGRTGWIRVTNDAQRHALRVEVSSDLVGVIPTVLACVRRAFDVNAFPTAITEVLGKDSRFARSLSLSPGLRLPGAMDRFETALRTIVGQQVSVSAATTVMSRIVRAFGEPVSTPWPQLCLNTITAERIARESIDSLAPLGLNAARANAILGMARAVEQGRIQFDHSMDPERSIQQFQELPGIGPWTANYFGMRILAWPDAFIGGDLVIRKHLSPMTPKQIEATSQAWRPWRAYAVMHLWNDAGFFQSTT